MKLSLPDISLPSFASVKSAVTGSAVGVDIGTSSVKIVQLRKELGTIILDTYGEIPLDSYRDLAAKGPDSISPQQIANAISDLVHEVNVTARSGNVGIPSSSAFVVSITTPPRDGEQLAAYLHTEIQKYIPVPVKDVIIDWSIISAQSQKETIFNTKIVGDATNATTQKVLLTAMYKEKVAIYKRILDLAGITSKDFEIETVCGARVAALGRNEPILCIDLGAGSTKIYLVENAVLQKTHTSMVGGQDLTRALSVQMNVPFEKAETLKRKHGLILSEALDTTTSNALTSALAPLTIEIERMIADYRTAEKKEISKIVLLGGGSKLLHIADFFASFNIPIEIAHPFALVQGPMVLEGKLREDGPTFANALGLALQAIG